MTLESYLTWKYPILWLKSRKLQAQIVYKIGHRLDLICHPMYYIRWQLYFNYYKSKITFILLISANDSLNGNLLLAQTYLVASNFQWLVFVSWLDYSINILTIIICLIRHSRSKYCPKIDKPFKICQRLKKISQTGDNLPNLVTFSIGIVETFTSKNASNFDSNVLPILCKPSAPRSHS